MNDVLFAFRQVRRQPGLSVAAILTLGLGLGSSLAVFTLVNAVLIRPLPYPDPDRLMAIGRGPAQRRQITAGGGFIAAGNVSHRDVQFLRKQVRTCGPIAASVRGSGLNLVLDDAVSYREDRLVSHQYFDTVGIQPTWGRSFTPVEDAPVPARVVILNERFLRQQNFDPATMVGREIQLGGSSHIVIGVLAARHTRPSDPDIYRPLGSDSRGGGQNLEAICRLANDASAAALDAELAALTDGARRARLIEPGTTIAYSAIARHEWEFGSFRPQLMTLVIAVALVLIVAAANTTGLLLVRAAGRRREISVRVALGAGPGRVARALIIEGMLLALLAGAIGLAAAPLLIRGLLFVAPPFYGELALFSPDALVAAATLGLCVLVGLAVSVPPVLELLRLNLRDALQEDGRGGTAGRRSICMRHLLIGAETAVSAILLVGALLLLKTFVNLMNVDTGVDSSGVLTARMSIQGPQYENVERLIQFFEQGVERLEQSPSIEAAAVAASLPAERALNLPARFPDSAEPDRIEVVNWRYVTPGYFSLLRLPHLTGRTILQTDRAGTPPVALVNETFARQTYGNAAEAIGRRIAVGTQPPREIVGVVADTSGWSLREPSQPMMFVPLAQVEGPTVRIAHSFFPPRWIVRSAGDTEGARRQLESVIRNLDPTQPFIEIQSLDALMINSVAMQRFYLVVLSTFALFAVALAAVGIYAAYSYAVASRRAEIGVRLALGAAPQRILRSIVAQALRLGGAAIGVGLAAATAASRVLQSILFEVQATDPATYAVVGGALIATVVIAALIPAIRAARTDPLAAIRG